MPELNFSVYGPESLPDASELEKLYQLDQDFFPTPWTHEGWKNLHAGDHLLVVAKSAQRPIGLILFQLALADSFAHLLKILVIPNFRKNGVAINLLRISLDELKKIQCDKLFLEVEEDNEAAIGLYKKLGLKVIHRKKDFYGQNRAALIMTSNC